MTGFGASRGTRALHSSKAMLGMAQHREAAVFRWKLLGSGLLLTGMLAGAIQLGNTVTDLRREVHDLTRLNRNLEARRAHLAVHWNTESSRQVVMRRAEEELGLVIHEAPPAILISRREGVEPHLAWLRWLQRLGPVSLTPAAVASPDAP